MTDEKRAENGEQQSIYLGNAVPRILRWTYVAFVVWAAGYLALYALPDLLRWLK
jgi:hypothetical protein